MNTAPRKEDRKQTQTLQKVQHHTNKGNTEVHKFNNLSLPQVHAAISTLEISLPPHLPFLVHHNPCPSVFPFSFIHFQQQFCFLIIFKTFYLHIFYYLDTFLLSFPGPPYLSFYYTFNNCYCCFSKTNGKPLFFFTPS